LSVDIWAVGMLALQLLLGNEELPALESVTFRNQVEIDGYLASVCATLGSHRRVYDAGARFVRNCLAYDSERRPTARQAFRHDWLQEPESDRKMFERLEADNASFWKPQHVRFPVIEDLTAEPVGGNPRDKKAASVAQGQELLIQDAMSCHFWDSMQGMNQ
jgi:serine/threonine protein kinase